MTDTDTMVIPVLDAWSDQPTDWLAAAAAIQPIYLGDHAYGQLQRAVDFLYQRQERPDAARRAAVILNADEWAPELERMLGIRLAIDREGDTVKCRACKRQYLCLPEDPYFDAHGRTGGLCSRCMLTDTRMDDAIPVVDGVVVGKVTRPRKNGGKT